MTYSGKAFAGFRAREFDWTGRSVYLNAASFGPLPLRARAAIDEFNAQRWRPTLTDADLMATLKAGRTAAAQLIGAQPDEIALVPNTNVGLNIAANAALRMGDERRVIVVSEREFPANVYPWLALEHAGYRVEIIPTDEDGWPREDAMLERIAQGDVAAASVSFVQFASGYRADLNALSEACRAQGTLFVVDAIQGVGAVPLNVSETPCDILACGGQKWLCSPWGAGFAYVRRDLIPRIEPLLPGWLAFEATQDFNKLTEYRYDLLSDARRFETGSLPFQDFLGFSKSAELLLELGLDNVWLHIRSLLQPIIQWARENNAQIVSDLNPERRSGILCVRPPDAQRIFSALTAAEVRCALRENAIRFSPHWYNTIEEMERILDVLDASWTR